MINDHKSKSERKSQLTTQINFISSKDSEETRTKNTKSHNVEIIEALFGSLLQNCQKDLEESMRRSEFNFDSAELLYYHLQKISLKGSGSYIYSPECLKK